MDKKRDKIDMKKKHRFSKLEIALIFFVLLLVAGSGIYTKSMNFSVMSLFSKKAALKQRYERLNYLIANREIGQYYDEMISPKEKSKLDRERFINEAGDKKPLKQTITTHSITIKDNIGYIDRTLTECTDANCNNKIEKRIYKKWEFKEGNWYQVGTEYCIRDIPYSMPPEFERALSLLKQRQDQKDGEPNDWQYLNCVDIQYKSIPNAEGYFKFDQNSTLDRLTIFVDNSYKLKDDLLTAFLLSHELNHVLNFLVAIEEGTTFEEMRSDCYYLEISAFTSQLNFLVFAMNTEERNSLIYRLSTLEYNEKNPLQLVKTFGVFISNSFSRCGQNTECLNRLMGEYITQMVESNPYYQKQCAGE